MLRKLLSSSAIYIVASVITGVLGFALLPIYTRFLSPEDYGVLGLIGATLGILGNVVGLNPQLYLTAKFAKLNRQDLQDTMSAALVLALVMAVPAVAVLEFFRWYWPEFEMPHWAILAICSMAVFAVIKNLLLTTLQMRERPALYAGIQVGSALAAQAAAICFVVGFGLDWRGKFGADAAVAGLFAAISITILARRGYLSWRTTRVRLKKLAAYSFPLLPHALGFWAINAQDRYFVAEMSGLEAAGIYTVAYSLGAALNFVHTGVLKAFSPYFYRNVENEDFHDNIVLMTYAYIALAFVVFLAFVVAMHLVVPYLVGDKFTGVSEFVPWIALGYTFNSVRNFMTGYLYVANRTKLLGALTLVAAAINGVLNYILIGHFGAIGAAYATAATFGVITVITTYFAINFFAMPWLSALTDVNKRN